MKNILGGLGLALLIASTKALAEDYSFPTDILERGTMDFSFVLRHDSNSTNIRSRANYGRQSQALVGESVQIRYGLGGHTYLGAALFYNSQYSVVTDYFHPRSHRSSSAGEGQQNPDFWFTYGLISDPSSPFTLTTELRLSPNTTGDPSAYTGKVSAGWSSSENLRFFGSIGATEHPDRRLPGATSFNLGIYRKLSESLTLTVLSGRTMHPASDAWSSWQQRSLGFSASIRIANKLYLVPNMVLYHNDASASKISPLRREATNNGRMESLMFHYIF